MEVMQWPRNTEEISRDLQDLDSLRPIDAFSPANAAEQQKLFLAGEIEEPVHQYDGLVGVDYAERAERFVQLNSEIQCQPDISPIYKIAYSNFINERLGINRLMEVAGLMNSGAHDLRALQQEYRTLNETLYGSVDPAIYQSLVHEKMRAIAEPAAGDVTAMRILSELNELLPVSLDQPVQHLYRPQESTVAEVKAAAELLYGNMLRHVPERDEPFTPSEVAEIFNKIIKEEFGEAAVDWLAELTKEVNSIRVVARTKRVLVPEEGKNKTTAELRGLVAHELGVHMLRAIRGDETDLYLLGHGVAGYYFAEEGHGMVMQQAISGKYSPSGVEHYLTIGYMNEGHGFRETFEMKWRTAALKRYKAGHDISPEDIQKARLLGYKAVRRIARGTDQQPWHKDLGYHDGSVAAWQYYDRHAGDELMLNLALLGKHDPNKPEDIRTILNTKERQD